MGIQTRVEAIDCMSWAPPHLMNHASIHGVLVAKANGVVQLWDTEVRRCSQCDTRIISCTDFR